METERLGTEVTMDGGPGSQQAGPLGTAGPLSSVGLFAPTAPADPLGASEGTWPAPCQLELRVKTVG